jgi:hypothetical protein
MYLAPVIRPKGPAPKGQESFAFLATSGHGMEAPNSDSATPELLSSLP